MKRTSSNHQPVLRSLLQWQCRSRNARNNRGFTLIELLVVVVIAGGIISGLMYLVVELLTADQREASRNQTQQEMQMAMDYVASELREAVYVYEGECLGTTAPGSLTPGEAGYCPGLYNYIPASLTPTNNSHPIVAFWKQQPLPTEVKNDCGGSTVPTGMTQEEFDGVCIAGHAYALVVYSLNTDNASGTWDGKARITRYALTQFENDGDLTPGYVTPAAFGQQFRSWPFYRGEDEELPTNQQTVRPTASGSNPAVLVDFVDFAVRGAAACPDDDTTANNNSPGEYSFTSGTGTVSGVSDSFYACISASTTETGENRDVILYLRGNAYGRPTIGNSDTAFLPTLETRVLSRPVIGKSPE